jgi:4-hydroxybenzoate polyprenyltransferase
MTATATARQLLLSSRPVSWINTAYPFAAATVLTTGRIDATLIVGTVFFLIPYNLAMYGINDVFDYESDLRNRARAALTAPCSSVVCTATTLWAAALSCLPFVVYLVLVGTPSPGWCSR